MALVIDPHGQFKTVDQVSQAPGLAQAKDYKRMQDENFANLRNPDEQATGGANFGYREEDEEGAGMSMSRNDKRGRRNNPLRRGRGGRGGSDFGGY